MEQETRALSARITPHLSDEIERIATKRRMTKTQVVIMIMELGVDLHKDLENVGIISAVDFAHYVKQGLKLQLENSLKTRKVPLGI